MIHLIQTDVSQGIPLSDKSVNCVVTSPPYWGLRDYGLPPSVWGGNPNHEHQWGSEITISNRPQRDHGNDPNGFGDTRGSEPARAGIVLTASQGSFCDCGAWRGCLGLEPTPELYIQHLVEIFRDVRRVLRDDGTLWLNLGDSYCGTATGSNLQRSCTLEGGRATQIVAFNRPDKIAPGLKTKDLVGIPWLAAFALRADGWYLRSDIVWSKSNPMPESVTDRPTKAHEYVFLLSKNERYYFDSKAVKEPVMSVKGNAKSFRGGGSYVGGNSFHNHQPIDRDTHGNESSADGLRNIRSVWNIATQPYRGAHFATFPEKLVEPCVKAGCPVTGLILDPFGGSGTVGVVAGRLGRSAVILDMNPNYLELAKQRNGIPPASVSSLPEPNWLDAI